MNELKSHGRTVFVFGIIGIALAILLFLIFARYWLPALIGVMMALSCHPLKIWFERKIFKRRKSVIASSLTCVALIATTVLPVIFAVTVIVTELMNILREAPALISEYGDVVLQKTNSIVTRFGGQSITYSGGRVKSFLVQRSGGALEKLSSLTLNQAGFWGEFFLSAGIAFLVMYFCLADAQKIKFLLVRRFDLKEDSLMRFSYRIQSSLKSITLGILSAAVAQSIVMGLAFYFAGLPGAKLSAAATFIFAFVPLLGSWPMAVLGVLIGLVHSDYKAVAIVVIFSILAGVSDNVVKVWIGGEDEEAHSLLVFLSIIGGLELMGPVGLIFGPLALNLFLEVSDKIFPTVEMIYANFRRRVKRV